ncbi:MAG: DNA/RNA non-specific endonuclease [Tenuifilaceae bacterium]
MKKFNLYNIISLLLLVILIDGCRKDDPSFPPKVSTLEITDITTTSVLTGGDITSDGGESITARGVCWSLAENPTIASQKTNDGSGPGVFTSTITGLTAGGTYHVRAYATNKVGTSYGADITFTTLANTPTLTTVSVTSITNNNAVSGGNVTSNGGATIILRGICWSTTPNPTIANSKTNDGTGTGSYTSYISGLTESTLYYIRAYATNSAGTAYGNEIIFTTLSDLQSLPDNYNLLLGNPSDASTNILFADNYLMIKPQYCLSYSNSKLTPNWTSWHLYSGDMGSTSRQDDFREDQTLPQGWYQVSATDYQYSIYGFDRGHMCPSADRTMTVSDNSATFLMTNIIPQSPRNNQQTWANLENYCRSLVDSGNELFIISGPYGQGGTSAAGTFSVLGSGVVVPNKTWKIIVVLSNGNNDLSRITTTTRVIAVLMPNDQSLSTDWKTYRVSVDSLETLLEYDFLSNVSTSIQSVIEARIDNL